MTIAMIESTSMTATPLVTLGSEIWSRNTARAASTAYESGFKQSGIGRELGPHALEHYTELKNVFLSTT